MRQLSSTNLVCHEVPRSDRSDRSTVPAATIATGGNSALTRIKIALSVTILFAAVLAVWMRPWASPEPPDTGEVHSGPVIAKVGTTPVYLSQAQSRYGTMASIHGGGTGGLTDRQLRDEVLESLRKDVAILEGARQRGVGMAPAELALYVSGVTGPIEEQGTLAQGLAQLNLDLPELERRVYLNFLGARLYQDVTTSGLSLTDQEIRAYYRKHKSEYNTAGEDPVVAFNAVKPEIAQVLIKDKQDSAWSDWFDALQEKYDLEVVDENWWEAIKKTEAPGSKPSSAPVASPSP